MRANIILFAVDVITTTLSETVKEKERKLTDSYKKLFPN